RALDELERLPQANPVRLHGVDPGDEGVRDIETAADLGEAVAGGDGVLALLGIVLVAAAGGEDDRLVQVADASLDGLGVCGAEGSLLENIVEHFPGLEELALVLEGPGVGKKTGA